MMWNDPKLIFIHIPKTGGVSIEHLLHRCKLNDREPLMGQHACLQDAYKIYGDKLLSYDIFTVKRNTFHRIVSLYLFLTKNHNGGNKLGLPKTKKPVSFEEYYTFLLDSYREGQQVTYAEDFYYYCGLNGALPPNIKILDFNKLEEQFVDLWVNEWQYDMPITLPFMNTNEKIPTDDPKRKYLLQDSKFISAIEEIYESEIKLFDFKPY